MSGVEMVNMHLKLKNLTQYKWKTLTKEKVNSIGIYYHYSDKDFLWISNEYEGKPLNKSNYLKLLKKMQSSFEHRIVRFDMQLIYIFKSTVENMKQFLEKELIK